VIKREVRLAVLARAGGCCEDCGEKLPLELHHLRYEPEPSPTYRPWEDPIPDGWETPDDLDALCRDHHHGRHVDLNGEFWRDPVEMEAHWFGYHWAMDKDD